MRLSLIAGSLTVLSAAAWGADPALLNLVMPEARVVAGMDVQRARNSYLGQKFMEQLDAKGGDFAKFAALTGFDPRRDLREIVVAAADAASKDSPALVVVRGAFDTARINGFMKVAGLTPSETLGGIDLFVKPDSKENMGFAIIDSSMALAGNTDLVRAALKRRVGGTPGLSAGAYAKLQSMSAANDIWLVSSLPVAELAHAMPGSNRTPRNMMGGDAFRGIEQSALGVRFGTENVEVNAEAVSRTEKEASGVADVVRFLSSLIQMNRSNPDLKALATALEAMTLTTDAKTTKVSISLPTSEIEKMLKTAGRTPGARKI